MGVTIRGTTAASLDTVLVHAPSSATLRTTPPKDNGGDGSAFSPTDLLAAALASCAVTILMLEARKLSLSVEAVDFEVVKEMSPPPRRIARLRLDLRIRSACSADDFARLVNAAKGCPVRRSLHPDIEIDETYTQVDGRNERVQS